MKFDGLNENEVSELRRKFGENVLPDKLEFSKTLLFLSQFKSPLIYIVLFAAFLSLVFKEYIDASLIGVVVVLNVIMGFFQEYNAQKTLEALRRIIKPKTTVIRDGQKKEVETKELVPGDLVVVDIGDRVPADGKLVDGLIDGSKLLIREAILTGEEEPMEKTKEKDSNRLFMGTIVAAGRGIMKVEKTGRETEIGKIGKSLSEIKEEKTPLQVKLEDFARNLAWIIVSVCLVIFLVGVLHQEGVWYMFKMAIILAVAAIPEGLPIAVTIILALGMRRILKRHGLVKKLLAIETLGAVSVICTDKTGTLTEGIMRVAKTDFVNEDKAIFALTLANDQRNNLEIALWDYIKSKGKSPKLLFDGCKRVYEESFTSEKKYMMTINEIGGHSIAFIMGAPEIVLSFCGVKDREKKEVFEKIEKMAAEGLKVLGLAAKESGELKEKKDFSWLGLVGVEDPIREGVREAISFARSAGIEVKIVTGDYRKTAEKVALNLGFKFGPENVMEGQELENISEAGLKKRINDIILFTRATPHQKLKIVKALQDNGEAVSMTGDGVNDALALKKANIGVVLGDSSDVAKEAGDLILLDNNFKTIIAACEEGRLIFSNIKKVVGYVLSNSFAEIFLIFGAMVLNFAPPLTVAQILWIHLVCDGPPDIVLGFEKNKSELMKEKPKEMKKEGILSGPMKFLIFSISLIIGSLSLFFFWYFYKTTGNLNLARTVAFSTVVSADLVYIFSFKSLKRSIFKTEGFFQNKYLFLAVLYGFLLTFAAIYLPGLNKILGTTPLKPIYWFLALSVAVMTTLLIEIVKFWANKRKN